MDVRRTLSLIVLLLLVLPACAPRSTGTSTVTLPATMTPAATDTPTPPPTGTYTPSPTTLPTTPAPVIATTPLTPAVPLTPTPGILISGYVKLQDGTGLAGVVICRNYASYNGVVVATTDASGFFRSDFAYIPGDEMIGVWPVAPGYTFDPPAYRWRHYYGPEGRALDFLASPGSTAATPPASCP